MKTKHALKFSLGVGASCLLLAAASASHAQTSSSMSPSARPPAFPMSAAQPPARPAADNQAVLDAMMRLGAKPIETLSPAEARRQPSFADGVKAVMKQQGMSTAPDPAVTTRDLPYGRDPLQKARVYKPANAPAGAKLPVVVYYHGGGWVIADLTTYDATPRTLAKQLNAVVVSVGYRHAPEAKFPAQHDDANQAYDWVLREAGKWGGDTSRVAVAGESAGGNLAVNVAVHARDRGLTAPLHVLSVYPIASGDPTLKSKADFANAKPLNTAMLMWFGHYVTTTPADMQDPRWDLSKANLRGLPPVTIVNAQVDPLADDGAALETALRTAGVPVERRVFPGATHEFFGAGKVIRAAFDAEGYATGKLKSAFGQ